MTGIRKDRLAIVIVIIIMLSVTIGYLAQGRSNTLNETDKIGVAVTIGPEVEFVKAVGGDKVDVTLMVPPSADVHTYEPLPSQLSKVAQARMYVQVGSSVEFETNNMERLQASNPSMLVVNASEGIQLIPGSEDEHSTVDSHVWVSPRNARIMVNNIYRGLLEVDPANREYYQKNRDQYLDKLDELDRNTTALLKDKTKPILILHPSFNYYARDYNLTMEGVMINDEEPSPQRIAMIVDLARENNITLVYMQPQYDPKYMQTIASQIGGEILIVSDLDENYLENMNKVAQAFSRS